MNYYEILEVSPKASPEVLKAAYKSLMQRYHPDKNQDNVEAAAHSVLLAQAYEVLSDSDKRAVYDIELKRQLENSIKVRDRNLKVPQPVYLDEPKRKSSWLLLLTSIVLVIWIVWLPKGEKPSSGTKTGKELLNETGALPGNQTDTQQNKASERVLGLGARTIPIYIKDLDVNLEASAELSDASANGTQHVLTIQTLGVVVGAFDAEKFISFLEDHKPYIKEKLAVKLESAKYEILIKNNGHPYLKQLILDSIGEITATNRLEEYPSTGTESPAHYGVVDVLLPDSFAVKPK